MLAMLLAPLSFSALTPPAPRSVRIDGQRFVAAGSNATLVMAGPNVVVKGPPYLPSVSGDSYCHDVTDGCAPNCESCTTFNEADAAHLKTMGWNAIRLGVVWAGAQPVSYTHLTLPTICSV